MLKLPERLLKITEYVVHGKPMADIGSDHALLPCYLIGNGLCPGAICGELTYGPYTRAKKAVEDLRLDHLIQVRQGNGMEVLKPGEVTTVVMAGMGGNTIVEILESCLYANTFDRLVLQPAGALAEVRSLAADRGWLIEDESVINDRGYFVNIVINPQGSKPYHLSEEVKEFGPILLDKCHQEQVCDYLIYQLHKYDRIIGQIFDQGGEEARATGEKYVLLRNRLEAIMDGH